MTVSTTNYTSTGLTKKIQITGETTSTNVIAAVNAAITSSPIGSAGAGSWILHDTLEENPPGTGTSGNAFSPINTYVFRAPIAESGQYKYFIMRWDIINRWFWTSTCESWDATTTHLPKNECWTNSSAFIHGYDLRDGYILITGGPKFLMIWSWIANVPGLWSMVSEIQTISPEDTSATSTSWAWTCSLMLGTPFGATANTATSKIMFAPPRASNSATGDTAAVVYAPCTVRGMFPPVYPLPSGATGPTITVDTNLLHLGSAYGTPYGWDSTNLPAYPVSVDSTAVPNAIASKGYVYGMGITGPYTSGGEILNIPLDSSGGWPSATGVSSPVLALPLNGGYDGDATYATNKLSLTLGNTYTVSINKICPIGDLLTVLAASDGLRFWDAKSGTNSETILIFADSSGVYDVIYDGEQYVYAATSTGVTRVNVSSNDYRSWTTSSVTISGGCFALGIDKKYVYASDRTQSTTPSIRMINRSTFTVNAGAATAGTALSVAVTFGTPFPTYDGSVINANCPAGGNNVAIRHCKFTSDTGAQTYNVADPLRGTAAAHVTGTYYWMDVLNGQMWAGYSDNTSHTIYPLTITLGFGAQRNFAGNAIARPAYAPGGVSGRGDGQLLPIRGIFVASNKYLGVVPGANPGRGIINNPSTKFSTTVVNVAGVAITSAPYGASSVFATDGVFYYGAYWTSATVCQTVLISNYYGDKDVNGDTTGLLVIKA